MVLTVSPPGVKIIPTAREGHFNSIKETLADISGPSVIDYRCDGFLPLTLEDLNELLGEDPRALRLMQFSKKYQILLLMQEGADSPSFKNLVLSAEGFKIAHFSKGGTLLGLCDVSESYLEAQALTRQDIIDFFESKIEKILQFATPKDLRELSDDPLIRHKMESLIDDEYIEVIEDWQVSSGVLIALVLTKTGFNLRVTVNLDQEGQEKNVSMQPINEFDLIKGQVTCERIASNL